VSGACARFSPFAPGVMIALGGVSVAAFLAAHFLFQARFAADALELLATFFVLCGGMLYLRRLPGHPRLMTVFGIATAVLLLARFLDSIEELPVVGRNGMLIDFLVSAFDGVGSIAIVATLLLLIRTVHTLHLTAEASHARFREAHESTQFLARVADMSADAIIGAGPDGSILSWNLGARSIFGYPEKEALGRNLSDLIVQGLEAIGGDLTSWLTAKGALSNAEVTACHSSGRLFVAAASISLVRDASGLVLGVSLIVRDIDERKKAEKELQATCDLLSSALRSAEVGLFMLDTDSTLMAFNHEMERITGFTYADFDAMELDEAYALLLGPDSPFTSDLRNRLFGRGESLAYRGMTLWRKGGGERHCNVSVTPLTNERGEVVAAAGVVTDLTERERLQAQILASRKLESMGRMAGGIAHDFNNILGGVLGYASILQERLADQPTLLRYARTIEESARRAGELTHQLLAFAHEGPSQLHPVNVNEVAREAAGMIRHILPDGVAIELFLDPALPFVNADPPRLCQALLNVLQNAREALDASGAITVRTRSEDHGRTVVVEVGDTGPGMPPEVCERMFEPFFTTREQGTGMGLAVTYGIVESHGGGIEAVSSPGSGTQVVMRFPAAPDAPAVSAAPRPANADTGRVGGQILVVDDEQLIRALVGDILTGAGYGVIPFASGEEAVAYASGASTPCDLAVVDLLMPGMNGSEVIRELRALWPGLPCVVITGYSADELDPVKGIDMTQLRVLHKPFDMRDFLRTVGVMLTGG
jgi:two-component system, cell cycle sensor histidine kinase and response regulator CckA